MTDKTDKPINNLIKQRGYIKARLTRTINSIRQSEAAQTEDINRNILLIKRDRITSIAQEFNKIQSEIECFSDDSSECELVEYRFKVENEIDEMLAYLNGLIDKADMKRLEKDESKSKSTHEFSMNLPTISIPSFSGDVTEWYHFRDVFNSLILNNKDLHTIQKFHYLLSALKGEARELIKNIPITEVNFANAYELITQRYDNPRLIATNHIKALLNLPLVSKNNIPQLRNLINLVTTNCDAINALNLKPAFHELLLVQIILEKLDWGTRAQFESLSMSEEMSSLNDLITFLERKCQINQIVQGSPTHNSSIGDQSKNTNNSRKPSVLKSLMVTKSTSCPLCKGMHRIYKCQNYMALNTHDKKQKVMQLQLCFNCLRSGHQTKACPSNISCFKCKGKHHTSLHFEHTKQENQSTQNNSQVLTENAENTQSTQSYVSSTLASCCAQNSGSVQVLLATAIVGVRDIYGNLYKCRALLDSGSQVNFITEHMCQLLKLKRIRNATPIESFNNLSYKSKHCVNIEIASLHSSFSMGIKCNILPKITADLPSTIVRHELWNIPQNITLADPQFYYPQKIDLLLGAQVFMNVLEMEQQIRQGTFPILQKTKVGWIVSGEYQNVSETKTVHHSFCATTSSSIDKQLQNFWELEEVNKPTWSREEKECEEHFTTNTTRDEKGRFIVKLPLKQQLNTLGDSRAIALRRFYQLERRLSSDKKLNEEYKKFLQEYKDLGHMRLAAPTEEHCYYLPHHPVLKQDSTTTKTRVVFDASCRTDNNVSLNDILMVGPVTQQDLCSIILRFRMHQTGFIADINKMYRQIRIHAENHDCQRILWRESPADPISEYQLLTVTYGTSSAPFLATRCLVQLAKEEQANYSEAAIRTLNQDFYVDDCISGTDHLDEAIHLVSELQALLASAGFQLRKWASNDPKLLETIPCELRETYYSLNVNDSETIKALGLHWRPLRDELQIVSGMNSVQRSTPLHFTKRQTLAIISSIFDPLGLLAPTVVLCKIFMQRLWKERLAWDDNLSTPLEEQWRKIYNSLAQLNTIHIERVVLISNHVIVQLHGFSDASEVAYGACIYIRSSSAQGEHRVRLLCAKSKVAPLKSISIPRLELCAALLLARLLTKVEHSMPFNVSNIYLWTDSNIVLAWLNKCPSTWKTFVANRVSEIQDTTSHCLWRHINSQSNPADLVSRGVTPNDLASNNLWWYGPQWLSEDDSSWPICDELRENSTNEVLEMKLVVCLTTRISCNEIIQRFSNLIRLQRVMSYCRRFTTNCKPSTRKRLSGPLTVKELELTLTNFIMIAQREEYTQEFDALSHKNTLMKTSSLIELNPFIDDLNLLRVGGRLQKSTLPWETLHQIILPPRHYLTRLIIEREHVKLLHAGPQLLIASLRCKYWIPNARRIVRSIVHRCLKCFRLNAKSQAQLMGSLPQPRVIPTRPFLNTGIDYAGPINVKTGTRRSKQLTKAYISVFVCLATRAAHLELVSDLTTTAFLAALYRFMARRGKCQNIYSDNATNFVGASNELKEMYAFLRQENETIANNLASKSCQWHFIPARAPHFGGLWESTVKSLKYHLRRVVGNALLTFEEMTTVLTQIESCLNSRPLCKLTDDPTDLTILTPSHFLIGESLSTLPNPDLSDVNANTLSRWQRVQQIMQHFWHRWSSDYLTSLQRRSKWTATHKNLQRGNLVLIKEDGLSPLNWKLAIIEKLHPGRDGLVRVVTLRTSQGMFKRPIVKVCLLPAATDDE